MINEKRERRDWTLLIFIIPIGILLILFVGQLAVRLVPFWSVNAGMNSNLEPDAESARPFALLEPILPQILTPMAWAETYLTPGADISFPPFLTFEPTATPSPTVATPSPTETTPTTIVTETPTPTATFVTGTPPPTGTPPVDETEPPDGSPTPPTPTTCQDPLADNFGGSLPCDYTSTTTCQDPLADNFGGSLPCDYTSTTTCQDPLADNFGNPLPCTYPPVATPTGTPVFIPTDDYTEVSPPSDIDTDAPDDNPGEIGDGTYVLIDFGFLGTPIIVGATPDGFYDLIFYEDEYGSSGNVELDQIIIGITNNIALGYYEVFNWGNNIPDTNTNADVNDLPADPDCAPGEECDNHTIPTSDLYPGPGTGILIDVDTAPAAPPPDSYNFVVIISPIITGSSGDAAQVDAVVVTEIPIPTP